MDEEQAYQLLRYNNFPSTKAEQIKFLKDVKGYTQLHNKPLERCSDKQIWIVAKKYHNQRGEALEMYDSFRREMMVKECSESWGRHLYDIFNIPEDEREMISASDLEQRLLD
tara:strand:+ start:2579 stop:2914 length:336 start_codon:yes stop_codon:yes gene_type:complete